MPEQFQHRRGRSQSCGSKMNRQKCAMQKPRRNRGRANQHASIGSEQSSKDCRTKNEEAGSEAQELIECPAEDLMSVQFKRKQTRNGASAECAKNPGAHRHGRSMFENAQHIKKEMRPTESHDEQNRRKNRSSDGREPHGRARKIDVVKNDCSACDNRRHSSDSAHEKVERNFPCP